MNKNINGFKNRYEYVQFNNIMNKMNNMKELGTLKQNEHKSILEKNEELRGFSQAYTSDRIKEVGIEHTNKKFIGHNFIK